MFLPALIAVGFVASISSASPTGVRYEGVPVEDRIVRQGKNVDGVFNQVRTLTTQINRVFERKTWSYEQFADANCHPIPGTGNGDWKGYWNATTPEDKVSALFQAIRGLEEEGAFLIVKNGFLISVPRTWHAFADEIRRADYQTGSTGFSRRVLGQFAGINRQTLGYEDREPQASGLGDWKGYWEATSSERPNLLSQAIEGLNLESARAIVYSGMMSDRPRSWRDFTMQIIEADRRSETGFSYDVLVKFGRRNMERLGYFDAEACTSTSTSDRVLRVETIRDFDRSAQRTFNIKFANAPLLAKETESFKLKFDGFKDSLAVSSDFYDYKINRSETSGGSLTYDLNPTRQMNRPPNTVSVIGSNVAGKMSLQLQDTAYDSDFTASMGELVVKVEVWEARFFGDKKLGEKLVVIPPTGLPVSIATGFAPTAGKKAYAYYFIRRTNSRFYSGDSSAYEYSEKVRF